MKTERFKYLHLLFGILFGFLLGSSLEHETGVWVRRALSAGAILFVALFWRRTESGAHTYHLEKWDELRVRGKWYFIASRYVLVRGMVLIVIFVGPWVTDLRFSGTVTFVLAFCGALLAPLLLYLGHQEWNDCARESEIQTLRKTAEFISSKQN
jgi:hypothetical protein